VHGPGASGKTVLVLHVIAAGLAAGETVALVTGEPADDVVAQGEKLGIPCERSLRKGQLAILEYDPRIRERIPHETGYQRVLEDLERALPPGAVTRVCFDPFHPLVNLENRYRTRGAVAEVLEAVRQRSDGCTLLVTGDTPASEGEAVLHQELRRHAFGILRLELGRTAAGKRGRRLVVEKTRWQSVEDDEIPFRISNGAGIVALSP
jgi:KaiC/GvpD/RAD55 family RecA-like ATPase